MKIFVSDYDGTFTKHDGNTAEIKDNLAQVQAWRRAGNIFVFATGRSVSLMRTFVEKGIECDYLVALNGGIVTSGDHKLLFESAIPHDVAVEIMALVKEWGFRNYTITDGFFQHRKSVLCDFLARFGVGFWRKIGLVFAWFQLCAPCFKNNVSYKEAMRRPVGQISIATDSHERAADFAALINQRFSGKIATYMNEASVDITCHGVSKATGIAHIAQLLDVSDEHIYCMGDSYNDIPMLETYHGFTVPKASQEVKAKAEGVYNTVGDAIRALL